MRLALVIEHLNPVAGGAERNCIELARALTRRGHAVTILCGRHTPDPRQDLGDLGIEQGPGGRPRTALRLWRFSRWIDRRLAGGDFDASLAFHSSAAADVLQPLGGSAHETQARNVAMRRGPAARLLKRAAITFTPKQWMLRRLERQTLAHQRVRAIAALSRYVCRQFEALGVSDARMHLIPNAVELVPPTEAQRELWRARVRRGFGVPEEATAYLFAAYNPRLKGVQPLLAALARLVEEGGGRVVVLLAGGVGYPEQAMAAALGVREHVRFVGPTRHMPALYVAADVTVHPTFYDPSSRIVIESLLCGTPAITTRYNGAADFLGEGEQGAGLVIDDPADAAALAGAMRRLADPARRQRCRAAMAGLAAELAFERHVDRIEALLVGGTARG